MKEAGYTIGNMDSTIIAQRPKLSPHKARVGPLHPAAAAPAAG